jgi:hypothetical protein
MGSKVSLNNFQTPRAKPSINPLTLDNRNAKNISIKVTYKDSINFRSNHIVGNKENTAIGGARKI